MPTSGAPRRGELPGFLRFDGDPGPFADVPEGSLHLLVPRRCIDAFTSRAAADMVESFFLPTPSLLGSASRQPSQREREIEGKTKTQDILGLKTCNVLTYLAV